MKSWNTNLVKIPKNWLFWKIKIYPSAPWLRKLNWKRSGTRRPFYSRLWCNLKTVLSKQCRIRMQASPTSKICSNLSQMNWSDLEACKRSMRNVIVTAKESGTYFCKRMSPSTAKCLLCKSKCRNSGTSWRLRSASVSATLLKQTKDLLKVKKKEISVRQPSSLFSKCVACRRIARLWFRTTKRLRFKFKIWLRRWTEWGVTTILSQPPIWSQDLKNWKTLLLN